MQDTPEDAQTTNIVSGTYAMSFNTPTDVSEAAEDETSDGNSSVQLVVDSDTGKKIRNRTC